MTIAGAIHVGPGAPRLVAPANVEVLASECAGTATSTNKARRGWGVEEGPGGRPAKSLEAPQCTHKVNTAVCRLSPSTALPSDCSPLSTLAPASLLDTITYTPWTSWTRCLEVFPIFPALSLQLERSLSNGIPGLSLVLARREPPWRAILAENHIPERQVSASLEPFWSLLPRNRCSVILTPVFAPASGGCGYSLEDTKLQSSSGRTKKRKLTSTKLARH
ncbi:hypothetical protein KM043_003588 [Ampulex compressa]|nr:hypothetical protein KM043_003588 [Ampulex compressa]